MSVTNRISLSDCPENWQTDPAFVYIGDEIRKADLKPHVWLTTRPVVQRIGEDRRSYLERYQQYILRGMEIDQNLRHLILSLAGRTLVCTCPPRSLCHGLVLAHCADVCAARQSLTDAIPSPHEVESWHTRYEQGVIRQRLSRQQLEELVHRRGEQAREDIAIFPPDEEDLHSMRSFFDTLRGVTDPLCDGRVQEA